MGDIVDKVGLYRTMGRLYKRQGVSLMLNHCLIETMDFLFRTSYQWFEGFDWVVPLCLRGSRAPHTGS